MITVDDIKVLHLDKVECSSCHTDEWGLLVVVSVDNPNIAFYLCDACRRLLIFCLVDQAQARNNKVADMQLQVNALPAGCIKFGCSGKVIATAGRFACTECQESYGPVRV